MAKGNREQRLRYLGDIVCVLKSVDALLADQTSGENCDTRNETTPVSRQDLEKAIKTLEGALTKCGVDGQGKSLKKFIHDNVIDPLKDVVAQVRITHSDD